MRYSKIIKLASYFKSSGNKETYFQLLKIASEARFEALVMGSYPSGDKNEKGEYDYTLLIEAKRKRDKVVELINDKKATILDLVGIINRIDRFRGQDNLSIWREGLNPEYFQELQSLISQPSPNQPGRDSGQSRGAPSRERPTPYYWNGMSAAEIFSRLSGLVLYHQEIFNAAKAILAEKISYPLKQPEGMFSFLSRNEEKRFGVGYILNYYPAEKTIKVADESKTSFTYIKLDKNLLNYNLSEKIKDSLALLIDKNPFTIKIPRSKQHRFTDGFIVDIYEIEGGFEIVTAWPPEEGEEKGGSTMIKKINTSDLDGLNYFFMANPQLFR